MWGCTASALPACAEIASVQSHAESALVQLAAVREREQLQLSRRAEALQRDFREHLAELEHRYTLQVGARCPNLPRGPKRMARHRSVAVSCIRAIWTLGSDGIKQKHPCRRRPDLEGELT